jgi:PST family polysaccharide transporter
MSISNSDAVAVSSSDATAASEAPPVSTRKALLFVYIGYFFRYLYMFILVPFYGHVLGAAAYGRVLAAMSLFQVVWMVAEGGLSTVGARDVAATSKNETMRAALYGRHQAARALMLLPAGAIGIAGTFLSPVLSEQPIFGILGTLNGLLTAFGLGWYFQALLPFRTSVIIETLSFVVSLPLILSLVHGPEDAWLVLFSFVISATVVTAVAHFIALRALAWTQISFRGAFGLLRESMTMFLYRSLATVTASSPVYVYSLYATAAQVGFYGAAERVATVALGLMQPATQVIFGTVSNRIADAESEGAAYGLMKQSFVVLFSSGIVMLLGTLAIASFAVPLIFGEEFGPVVPILQVLGVLFPFEAINTVCSGFVLIPLRMDRIVTIISFVTATATVVLIFVLGKTFGGIGVSTGRVLVSALDALITLEVLRRLGLLRRIFQAKAVD